MTLEDIKTAYPDLHGSIDKAAFDRGMAAGIEQGRKEGSALGATAERERILSVEAASLPGHEALITSLKFDGVTSGPEAALKIVAAERATRSGIVKTLGAEAIAPAKAADAPDKKPAAADAIEDESKPVEERAKAKWEKDPNLRAEFGELAVYTAYFKAQEAGQIKIYNKGGN